jgi:hypothetical protein
MDRARRLDGYMFEGFWFFRAFSYFCILWSCEGVSALGGVVEWDGITEEKPDGRCPRVNQMVQPGVGLLEDNFCLSCRCQPRFCSPLAWNVYPPCLRWPLFWNFF